MDYHEMTDKELDKEVAIKVMELVKVDSLIDENGVYLTNIYQDKHGNNLFTQTHWDPATDYNQIFGVGGVVEKVIEKGYYVEMESTAFKENDKWYVKFHNAYGEWSMSATTLPHAICIAALKAVEGK